MLCDKLREYRRQCGLSQQQVATVLNVDRATYSYYESGRTQPSLDNLKKIASVFGVHLYELLEIGEPAIPVFCDGDDLQQTQSESTDPESSYLGKLSDEEQELIVRFRTLSREKKSALLGSLGYVSEESEEA